MRFKNKRNISSCGIIIILLFIVISTCTYSKDRNKNILILNSYHQSYPWTDEQTRGILKELKSTSINYNIDIEYMDWKRYPSDENLGQLYSRLAYKYSKTPIDLVITTDDVAVKFTLNYRNEIFSNAPIIFTGLNPKGIQEIVKNAPDITGVAEQINPAANIRLAQKFFPGFKKVYLIYDNSESGLSTGRLTTEMLQKTVPDIQIISLNTDTEDELISEIQNADKDSIALIGSYSQDASGKFVDFQELCEKISHRSRVPIFQVYDFGLGHGAIGGNVQSGELQGEKAGDLALKVLRGEAIDNLPIQYSMMTHNMFDYAQLKRFNIPLSYVPLGSHIVNSPVSFFERYKTIIRLTTVAFFILILFISILLAYIRKINKMKRQLQDLAYMDTLTRLPNRLSLKEKLQQLEEQKSDLKLILMFIDSDNFKYINDTLGHAAGDRFIKEIGKRISFMAGKGAAAYRLGGDEFVVLFQGEETYAGINKNAERILEGFKDPFLIGEHILQATVSIGAAMYPEHAEKVSDLLKCADIAMYKAKEEGKNKYVIFNPQMNNVVTERMNIEKYLRKAVKKNQFVLHYQPQIDIKTGKIAGFEALVRWNSPELGFVPPEKFIEIAEDTHMIITLGNWILETACRFLKRLQKLGYMEYYISINVSIIQLMQDDFADHVINLLNRLGLDPKYIELEVTESVLAKSFDVVCNKLEMLRDKGINIALDDFGKGYSSLNYLRQLPITTLKIDKAFIDTILNESSDKTLTGVIVLMGLEMGLSVVAEGVETKEQLAYLEEKNCDKFQGYLAYKPLGEEDLLTALKKEEEIKGD